MHFELPRGKQLPRESDVDLSVVRREHANAAAIIGGADQFAAIRRPGQPGDALLHGLAPNNSRCPGAAYEFDTARVANHAETLPGRIEAQKDWTAIGEFQQWMIC